MFPEFLSKIVKLFEHALVVVLVVVMLLTVSYATYILIDGMITRLVTVDFRAVIRDDPDLLQVSLYRMFGNVLTILLGMELIHTVKIYFEENIVKIELIMVISIIALARHLIQLDYHDAEPLLLVGMAALMLVFIGGYLMMLRGQFMLDKSSVEE